MASVRGGIQVRIKSNAEEFWKFIKKSTDWFPRAIPTVYERIVPINSDGSVRRITCGPDVPNIRFSEEQITSREPVFSYKILGGDILNYCSSFNGHISLIKGEDGTWAKWTWEAESPKAVDSVNIECVIRDLAVQTLVKLDDYLARA